MFKKNFKDYPWEILAVTVVVIILMIFGENYDRQIWNNGYHAEDNGHWTYEKEELIVQGKTIYKTYYYICDKCDKEQIFCEKMDK